MPSVQLILAGAAIVMFGIVGILLLIPHQKGHTRRKGKPSTPGQEPPAKNWQDVSLKLERHIQALRREIDEYQRKELAAQRAISLQNDKYAKLQDKLIQERDWQKREEADVAKKDHEIKELKNDLKKYETQLDELHSLRLKYERERREVQDALESVTAERRNLELLTARLKAENETLAKEVRSLKEETHRLSQKKEAEAWVPKAEYEQLAIELKNRDIEIARLKHQPPQ